MAGINNNKIEDTQKHWENKEGVDVGDCIFLTQLKNKIIAARACLKKGPEPKLPTAPATLEEP